MSLQCSGDPAVPFPESVPQKCREFVRPLNEPEPLVMTAKAIALIDRDEASSLFFLQLEGAQIEKNDHGARPCEQIGETNCVRHCSQNCSGLCALTSGHAGHRHLGPRAYEPDPFQDRKREAILATQLLAIPLFIMVRKQVVSR
jgi:hypothetical protein